MLVNDPIGDTLTRIRNAHLRKYDTVSVIFSNMIISLLKILKEEEYILDYSEKTDNDKKSVEVTLKYNEDGTPAIRVLKRISKPGLRKYIGYNDIPKVINGLGISIISTPKGILSGKKSRIEKVGGELLCEIY